MMVCTCRLEATLSGAMKIVVENVTDGESIPYPVLFLKGRVENLDLDALKGEIDFHINFSPESFI